MITAIDTNILLDILIPDKEFLLSSKKLLDEYNEKGQLVICEVVYAELASQFRTAEDIRIFLSDTGIKLLPSHESSLAIAGQRWKAYSARRKTKNKVQCSQCGQNLAVQCTKCHNPVSVRQHIISDFIVGAHALAQADVLLSRDRGFYRMYFKDIKIGQHAKGVL